MQPSRLHTLLRRALLGESADTLAREGNFRASWLALVAWMSLGINSLSSSCYGPQVSFLALGEHDELGLLLAVSTAVTVFVIAVAYNQVVELFPSGGGGYRVATSLLGSRAGLISGAALVIDYVLTVAISVAAASDALFSLVPVVWLPVRPYVSLLLLGLLAWFNLRGGRETFAMQAMIVLGFLLTHTVLITYGTIAHSSTLVSLVPETIDDATTLTSEMGWLFAASLFLRAYSMGASTYTGLEVVSNNVQNLPEPRVRVGKWVMFYMALSLSMIAGGFLVVYKLWAPVPEYGQTLNAVVFRDMLTETGIGVGMTDTVLMLVLFLEAALLLLAANTGLQGGPGVLAHMALDSWVPRQFRQLSSRLVTQNGILLMAVLALAVLLWSKGQIELLVILYSINVFLTFTLSLLGLCVHWWRERKETPDWRRRWLVAFIGCLVSTAILLVTLFEKFLDGAWMTVVITGFLIVGCQAVRRHYDAVRRELTRADQDFNLRSEPGDDDLPDLPIDKEQPVAVFLVGKNSSIVMHALMWVHRMFNYHFKSFVFLAVGEIDASSQDSAAARRTLRYRLENSLLALVNLCRREGFCATYRYRFGTDPVEVLDVLVQETMDEYPNSICFASKLVFAEDNIFTRWLHNQTAFNLQRRLHLTGRQMVIIPMKIEVEKGAIGSGS